MRPADTTRAISTSEPAYNEATDPACQAPHWARNVRCTHANIPLFIGSSSTIEGPVIGLRELRSIQAHVHSSFEGPSDEVLAQVVVIYVYDIEESRRFLQLRRCCEYQRAHGEIYSIFAILRVLNVDLAERIQDLGSQFRLLGEAGFGPANM